MSSNTTPRKRGRPFGTRNKKQLFDRDWCMDILHKVAAREETRELTVYQVLHEAAREIISLKLGSTLHGETYVKHHIERVRKQLQRDQAVNDERFFSAVAAAHDAFDQDFRMYDSHDMREGPEGPPPTPWEEELENKIRTSNEDFRTLPQGYIHQAMQASGVIVEERRSFTKRRLKQR